MRLTHSGKILDAELKSQGASAELRWQGQRWPIRWLGEREGEREFQIGERRLKGHVLRRGDAVEVRVAGRSYHFSIQKAGQAPQAAGELTAPMPGKVLKILVEAGQSVEAGQTLMLLEAMKMEYPIRSPKSGRVVKFHFALGDRVSVGDELVELDNSAEKL